MTKGEYLVGVSFNPGNHENVSAVKTAAANLIDLVIKLPVPDEGDYPLGDYVKIREQAAEVNRLKAIAITHIETAAMFAVKAATKPQRI